MARTSTASYSDSWKRKDYYTANGQVISSNSGTTVEYSNTVVRGDIVKTSGPRQKPMRPLPYFTEVSTQHGLHGYYRQILSSDVNGNVTSMREIVGCLQAQVGALSIPPLVAFNATVRSRAEANAINKMKVQNVNIPLAFAEAGQVANLLADTATRCASAIRHVRKGRIVEAARDLGVYPFRKNRRKKPTHKEAHQDWLSLQYGWKPLLSDVDGAAREFAERNNQHPDRFCVRVVGNAEMNLRSVEDNGTSGPTRYTFNEVTKHKCRVILHVKKVNPTLAAAASQGWTNPAVLAWELLPFSFVVDWFIPIGDYLGSLDATLGWDFHTGCRIELREVTRTNPRFAGSHPSFYQGQLRGNTRRYRFDRIVYSAFPSRSLPRLKNPVSMTHVANAIALLRGAFT